MMQETFTHEAGDDPMPRRRVRISGPVYDDSSDDEARVIAGPFDTDSLAAAWIDDWREFGSDLAEALGPSIQIR
jgi:hypothetical protein